MPGGEIIPALEKGVIDAFEFNNPTSDMRFGSQDVIKNYMLGSYHQAMEFFEIAFNKKKWATIPKDLQAILQYAAEAANSSNWWTAMDNYSRDLQILKDKHKVNVIRTPKSIFVEQLKAWDVLTKKLSDEDPFFKKVVDSQRAWAKRVAYLHVPQRSGLQARLRARVQDQDPGLSAGARLCNELGRPLRVAPFLFPLSGLIP